MEQTGIIAKITALIDELGVPFDQIVCYWQANGKLNLEQFQKNLLDAPYLVLSKQVTPGMFVAPDNKIYRGMPEGEPVKAVIGFIAPDKVLAVCLAEESLPWSSDCLDAPKTRTMTSGLKATCEILNIANRTGMKAEAAAWCVNFAENGVRIGEAFLPSELELRCLMINSHIINKSLEILGKNEVPLLSNDNFHRYLSSNEENCQYARSPDNMIDKTKGVSYVRPVFWIDLKTAEFI